MRLLGRHAKHRDKAPAMGPVPSVERAVLRSDELGALYHPVMLGAGTLGKRSTEAACLREVVSIVERLDPDDYIRYLLAYYRAGLSRFGEAWEYADILTVLRAASELLQPQNYMEIGVRRGRSLAVVAATCPDCSIMGFDMWAEGYAGMSNPGPELAEAELRKIGHAGNLQFVSGDSHQTVPELFAQRPDLFFDLITVDGDHSELGAEQDLRTVMPRLKIGGVLVFDDIVHPRHKYLADVWQHVVADDPRFTAWKFTELGYGVALAVRRDA